MAETTNTKLDKLIESVTLLVSKRDSLSHTLGSHMAHDERIDDNTNKKMDQFAQALQQITTTQTVHVHLLERIQEKMESNIHDFHNGDSGASHQQDHRDLRKHLADYETRVNKSNDVHRGMIMSITQWAIIGVLSLAAVGLSVEGFFPTTTDKQEHVNVELTKSIALIVEQQKRLLEQKEQ